MVKQKYLFLFIFLITFFSVQGGKKYFCTYPGCDYSSVWPSNVRRHSWIHRKERPYYCNVCGEGFIQKNHIRKHKTRKYKVDKRKKVSGKPCTGDEQAVLQVLIDLSVAPRITQGMRDDAQLLIDFSGASRVSAGTKTLFPRSE